MIIIKNKKFTENNLSKKIDTEKIALQSNMKRLFLYFSKNEKLDKESEKLQRVQIDLCLHFGWSKDSIIIVSNILFEYNGIKNIMYKPTSWPQLKKHVSGWYISELYNQGILKGKYWVTDHDVFQIVPIDFNKEKRPIGNVDICTYGVLTRGRVYHPAHEFNLCGMFIDKKSVPFFQNLRNLMENTKSKRLYSSERATTYLKDPSICCLNHNYNLFAWNNLKEQYEISDKPIKAIHFHPSSKYGMEMMCSSNNSLNIILAPKELINILKNHGFMLKSV